MKKPFLLPANLWRRKRRRGHTATTTRRRTGGTVEVARPWWLRISPARAALGAGTAALLSLLLCIHLWPSRVSLEIGDRADREIVAQRTVQYEDSAATDRLRDAAAARVPLRFEQRPDAGAQALREVDEAYDALERAAAEAAPAGKTAPAATPDLSAAGLEPNGAQSAAQLLKLPETVRRRAREASRHLVQEAMRQQITDEPGVLLQARQELAESPALAALPEKTRDPVLAIARASLRPNLVHDAAATQRERDAARAAVPPQMRRLPSGAVVIRPGDTVAQIHLDKFDALGLRNPHIDALAVGAITALVVFLVALVAGFLSLFEPELYADTPRLFLLSLLVTISVVGLKIGTTLLGLPFTGVHLAYLGMMCVASAGMVISLLLSPSVAVLVVSILSVVSGLILNNEIRFSVITLGSSLVGIVSVATLRNRGDLVRAMVLLCGANVLLIALVGQLEAVTPREMGTGALWGLVSGLFALVLFWLGVAVFEKPFGITTHLRLLELSDPATPVLQEFRMRVPGTYAHSLMVGNLAHAAAEAIGADALLVRVAAYYHDLGKMNRPEFFIENQANAENIHDRLNPSLSALVLTSHVKEGLEMAEVVGLPPRVRDVIRQHHGTTLMKYFFFRATGGAQDSTLEAQFRYPGPKPQTKEAAILMLADSVEAASRTLDKPTPARIADFVARMVEEKRADGQLDESTLTLRDLHTIEDVFSRTLSATLHARIEYPQAPGSGGRPAATSSTPADAVPPTHPEEALAGALTGAMAAALTVVRGGEDGGAHTSGVAGSKEKEANGHDGDNGSRGGRGAHAAREHPAPPARSGEPAARGRG